MVGCWYCGVMFSTGMMWGQVANRGSLNPTVAAGHIGHLREVPRYGIVGTLGTLGTLGTFAGDGEHKRLHSWRGRSTLLLLTD